jgi:hypothetical protein
MLSSLSLKVFPPHLYSHQFPLPKRIVSHANFASYFIKTGDELELMVFLIPSTPRPVIEAKFKKVDVARKRPVGGKQLKLFFLR